MPPTSRSIVLIGLMGAGKTTIGRRLAAQLGLPFFDADHEIEAAAGCSVTEIFERHGEPAFRDVERKVIARLLEGPRHVLATGGGAFMNLQTRTLIREKALSIWLRADLDLLMERVSRRQNRPLLKTPNPRATMEKLMTERYPIYAEADLTIDSTGAPHDHIVQDTIRAIKAHAAKTPAATS
jgi:shikimate kinase